MTVKSQTYRTVPQAGSVRVLLGAALKAGLAGGAGVSLLLLVYQVVSFPFLQRGLIPPAILIVWIVTGIGAAMLAGEQVQTSRDGGKVGVLAGLVAGVVGGIASMVVAAFGATFTRYGEGILIQLSDTQLAALNNAGFTERLIVLSGSVIMAMFVCGVGGMVVSALLGGFGGWLYPKFNR